MIQLLISINKMLSLLQTKEINKYVFTSFNHLSGWEPVFCLPSLRSLS